MMRRTLWAAMLILAGAASGDEMPSAFFVAPDGRDTNIGTRKEPFATLERARDSIRALRKESGLPKGGVTVWLRGGIHERTGAFRLTKEDSGTKDASIAYRSYKDEQARLVGGRKIPPHAFKPVVDDILLDRFLPEVRKKVLNTDLKELGIRDFGKLTPRGFGRPSHTAHMELFYNARPMTLAQYPNDGFLEIASVPEADRFCYRGDRPTRWQTDKDVWVHGYWTHDWADSYVKVKKVEQRTRTIFTEEPHGVYGYREGRRFRFLNVLEELDTPGEWYLDRGEGRLYFLPPSPVDKGETLVSMIEEPMVILTDVSHVRLIGLTLESGRHNGVYAKGGESCLFAGCTVRNVGRNGIMIEGGENHTVLSCDIHDTGEAAIRMNGGDRKTLEPSGHAARNNHLYRFSRWCRTYQPAVNLAGVGCTVSNNHIHDAPHCGILVDGNDHVVEFNDIHDICVDTSDVGAFYIGRDWSERGNTIRHNYFHHLGGRGRWGWGTQAVYLDDCASGTIVYGNVFFKAGRAVAIGGGRDNVVENNIFVDCNPAVHVDARALGWAKERVLKREGSWDLIGKLEKMNCDKPPYSTKYPKLAKILEGDPKVPAGNVIAHNISVRGKWLDLKGVKKEWLTLDGNLETGTPGFADEKKRDFRLRKDSPAWKTGFKEIPFEKIGTYGDEYRKAEDD